LAQLALDQEAELQEALDQLALDQLALDQEAELQLALDQLALDQDAEFQEALVEASAYQFAASNTFWPFTVSTNWLRPAFGLASPLAVSARLRFTTPTPSPPAEL
jgi:hypothetical protein